MALTKVSGSILKDPLNLGEVSIGGTLTYQDVTNVDSVGVITARAGVNVSGGQVSVGAGTSLHSTGLDLGTGNITGHNLKSTGIITATAFHGSGANLTGLAGREVYGFTGVGNSLSLTTTNGGADNITNATYVAFEESFIGPSGLSFSINTSGNLIMTV